MTEEQQVIYCVTASSRTFKRPSCTHYLVSLHTDLYSAWQKIEQLYNSMLPILNEACLNCASKYKLNCVELYLNKLKGVFHEHFKNSN